MRPVSQFAGIAAGTPGTDPLKWGVSLSSGGDAPGARRVRKPVEIDGEVVRRPLSSWTPAVHDLLCHFESISFPGLPRVVGIEGDLEVVTYVPGEVGHYPLSARKWSDHALVAAATFLRRFHDATASYRPSGAPWRFVYPDASAHEVICHNDFAPYNNDLHRRPPRGPDRLRHGGPGLCGRMAAVRHTRSND